MNDQRKTKSVAACFSTFLLKQAIFYNMQQHVSHTSSREVTFLQWRSKWGLVTSDPWRNLLGGGNLLKKLIFESSLKVLTLLY